MSLFNKYQFGLILLASFFVACSQHQANTGAATHNQVKQASESKNLNSQPTVPSPAITPTPEQEVVFGKGLKIIPKEVKLENQQRRYKIKVRYPQIEGTKNPLILSLNNKIRRLATEQYRWLLDSTEPLTHPLYKLNPDVNNTVILGYEISLATDELLSIYFEGYSYGVGAAHSVQYSFTVNYDFRSERLLKLADIFKPNENHLQFISQYCIDDLEKRVNEFFLSKDYLAPNVKNYQSWNITKEGVRMNIDACTVFACAEGKQVVTLPFTILKDKLNPNSPIILYAK